MIREQNATIIYLVLLVFGLNAGGYSQDLPDKSKDFEISGLVLNAVTLEPISLAVVIAKPEIGRQEMNLAATTDTNGRFILRNIPAGRYFVNVQKTGFYTEFHDRLGASEAADVTVGNPGNVTLTIRLIPWAVISGRITNANGEALVGASVQLSQSRFRDGRFGVVAIEQTTTNDLGEYRIFGLRPGRYYLSAFFRDAASAFGLRQHLHEGSGEKESFEDYALTYYPGTPDMSEALPIKLSAGQSLLGLDLRIAMIRSVSVEGSLRDLPAGANATVFLQPAVPTELGASQIFNVTSENRRFLFKSIPPGDYVLTARTIGRGDRLASRRSISVMGSSVHDIVLPLDRLPSIQGRVTVEGDEGLPEGVDLVLDAANLPVSLPIPVAADGTFAVPSLMPGTYRLSLGSTRGELTRGSASPICAALLLSISLDGERLDSSGILDIDRSMNGLSVLVTTDVGSVEGVVTDKEGMPVSRGVAIAVKDGKGYSVAADIDRHGRFNFEALLPGEYRIMCDANVAHHEDLTQELFDRTAIRGKKIKVEAKTATTVQIVEATEVGE